MKSKTYAVYMMASQRNGTLYVGVTSDLPKRVTEHKSGTHNGFTKEYGVTILVYFETTNDINSALAREAQLKNWKRTWKLELIERENPDWHDLGQKILDLDSGSGPE